MSFYGKRFKKIKDENVDELLDALKAPERTRVVVKNKDAITSFKKNDDGTIQVLVTKDDVEVFTTKVTPGTESDFVTPEGLKAKAKFTVTDNSVETFLTFPDGKTLHMNRIFEGNTMKHVVWRDGLGVTATATYEAI